MKDETIICFCEDITLGEIREGIKAGARSFDELKRLLRCGMGNCQGKTCEEMVNREIMKLTGQKREELHVPRSRPPVVGIYMEDVIRGDTDEK